MEIKSNDQSEIRTANSVDKFKFQIRIGNSVPYFFESCIFGENMLYLYDDFEILSDTVFGIMKLNCFS